MNHFDLYGLPVSLHPDEKQVRQKFYELSRRYHPDFFTGASKEEQDNALELSSQINKAYKTFQNSDEIIRYVLQQKGLLAEEEKYELPSHFLMDMLELSEQMMEAKLDADNEAMTTVEQQIKNVQTNIYEPVKRIIENYKEGVTTEEELLQIKDYYYKKKYLTRILAGIN